MTTTTLQRRSHADRAPSPLSPDRNARPGRAGERGVAAVWTGVCLLCFLGVVLALIDAAGGRGRLAADAAFSGAPAPVEEAAPPARSCLTPDADGAEPEAPETGGGALRAALERRQRALRAEALIGRLVDKLRAEREARAEERRRQRGNGVR